MIENINPYDAEKFKEEFTGSSVHDKLRRMPYTDIVWEDEFKPYHNQTVTGRHFAFRRVMYMASFYYIRFLQEVKPAITYDIGCGANIFAQFFPVHGISGPNRYDDDEMIYGDERGEVNDEYVERCTNRFPSAFSINALHFTNFKNLQHTMEGFIKMIRPGGRGYLALNIARLDDYTGPEEMLELFGIIFTGKSRDYAYSEYERSKIDSYIREAVSNLKGIDILAFEIVPTHDEYIDGNIRLVFEKQR